jgi:hypothetical protein
LIQLFRGAWPLLIFNEEFYMKSNVGGIDRIVRIVLGLVLIGLTVTGTIGVWGWLGVVPLATGALGWCPPYAIFGFNTCSMKN